MRVLKCCSPIPCTSVPSAVAVEVLLARLAYEGDNDDNN